MSIFLNSSNGLKLGDDVFLNENQSHYVVNILRKKILDYITISNGRGSKFLCSIYDPNNKKCKVKVIDIVHKNNKTGKFSLAISLLKNVDRLEWCFEKATEFGVDEIIPFIGDRTERKNFNEQRLTNIVISAMLQSKRFFLPYLSPLSSLENLLKLDFGSKKKYFAHCAYDINKIFIHDIKIASNDEVVFFVGPEGDFSDNELNYFKKEQFLPVSLGENRLRSESAGVFVCGYFYGIRNYYG